LQKSESPNTTAWYTSSPIRTNKKRIREDSCGLVDKIAGIIVSPLNFRLCNQFEARNSNPPSGPVPIDQFWESVPAAWQQTRSQVRHNAFEKFQLLHRLRNGRVSESALAEASQTSRNALSQTVDSLVTRGLVIYPFHPSYRERNRLAPVGPGKPANVL